MLNFIGSSFKVRGQRKEMGLYWLILTVSTHSIRPGWATALQNLQNQLDDFIYRKQLRSQKNINNRSPQCCNSTHLHLSLTSHNMRPRAKQRPQQADRVQHSLGLTTESGR